MDWQMTANIFKGDVYMSFPENTGWTWAAVAIVRNTFYKSA